MEEIYLLLADLQFPVGVSENGKTAYSLLQRTVLLMPDLQYARDIAALSRSVLLSPSIWQEVGSTFATDSNKPVSILVSDAFRSCIRARLARPNRYPDVSTERDIFLFISAIISGIDSCSEDVSERSVAVLTGVLSSSPVGCLSLIESAYVAIFNELCRNPTVSDPLAFAVLSTISFGKLSPPARNKLCFTSSILDLYLQVLFSPSRAPLASSYAGPLAQMIRFMFPSLLNSSGPTSVQSSLDIISEYSHLIRTTFNSKESVFSAVAALTGLVDALQITSRFWTRASKRTIFHICSDILIILRNLSTTIYKISLSGFGAEGYLHSATIGLLVSTAEDMKSLISSLQQTDSEAEKLFYFNTVERILLASTNAKPLAGDCLSDMLDPARQVISNVSRRSLTESDEHLMTRAIHEAAHAVFLASLQVPAIASSNANYVRQVYLLKILWLFDDGLISSRQVAAAIHAIISAFTPESGILCYKEPEFAQSFLLPLLRERLKRSNQSFMLNLYLDTVFACASPNNISYWLTGIEGAADAVAQHIRNGDIPSICADNVIQWWFLHQTFEQRSSHL
ncbi:uncharacterized protein V1516DRAFT_679004 [Lipomyces oligophaga]|uniref:uncharacterized protein n=1 Tax=Lipomyces oligophaga TaxID=45792 RepID=UPI0034CED0FC